ncbi:unnamed protein product [Mortierella alpina]
MGAHSPEIDLSPCKTLELAHLQLNQARQALDSKDTEIAFAICKFVDSLLNSLKAVVKRPHRFHCSTGSIHDVDPEKETLLCQEIASTYLDLARLMADLGKGAMAQTSRQRADKWGGPGVQKTFSVPQKKVNRALGVATVSKRIFPDDIRPPTLSWTFPEPDGRVADTLQLVSCLSLLKLGSEKLAEDAVDPAARKWLQDTENNEDERLRLKNLAMDLIRAFESDGIKNKPAIDEILYLVPILEKDDYLALLKIFFRNIKGELTFDSAAFDGLARTLQHAPSPTYLAAEDLIKILTAISTRLQRTHKQSPAEIFELTVAVSSVLNAMVHTNVSELKREELHGPLLAFLGGLQADSDPHLKYYASYAYQALLCVPDDESPWEATVRRTTKVVRGVSGMISAVKGLDVMSFLDSLQQGFDGVEQIFQLAHTTYERVTAVYEAKEDLVSCLKEGFARTRKCAWYSALRGADILIDRGELAKFRELVCRAVCRGELAFQWGVCQRLANLAANTRWDEEARRGAVRFLDEIYRCDNVWGQLPPIKAYILDILQQLSEMDKDVQGNDREICSIVHLFENHRLMSTLPVLASSLLTKLAMDGDEVKKDFYRRCTSKDTPADPNAHVLVSNPLGPAPSSLMDGVQRRTDVEVDLRRITRLRRNEKGKTVYIPPMAKSDLRASDGLFPLSSMVNNFLVGNDKVLLLLGASGAGKSTFNRQLELQLWYDYKPSTGIIPLLISLPAIDGPDKDLIAKHLRLCEFSEPQIRELKGREFIIICDGYDESQLTQNLYLSNGFNKDGGWKVKMVVSCRSEHLGEDYHYLFQPERAKSSGPALFKQAVLVPFSFDQVKEYIDLYVDIERPLWGASDYVGILEQIPSLQDLVTNPFLLTLSLEVLPRISEAGQTLTSNKITRVLLYDEFVVQWLERNKKRLSEQVMTDSERKAFRSLSDDGFTQQGLAYLKDLSSAIYKEQEGNPVIEYLKARDAGTWKEKFFGRHDEEKQLLQRAIPMTRNGGRLGFIHRSILEYGVCRAIYEPQSRVGLKAPEEAGSKRRNSVDSTCSFDMFEEVVETTITPTAPAPKSILATRSFIKDTSVLQFLVERVHQEPAFKNELLGYIEASKVDKSSRTAAANAITILVRAGVRFYGVDLKGIQIPRADLSGGHFDSIHLKEAADLRKTNLSNIWLRQVNLNKQRAEVVHICTGR